EVVALVGHFERRPGNVGTDRVRTAIGSLCRLWCNHADTRHHDDGQCYGKETDAFRVIHVISPLLECCKITPPSAVPTSHSLVANSPVSSRILSVSRELTACAASVPADTNTEPGAKAPGSCSYIALSRATPRCFPQLPVPS